MKEMEAVIKESLRARGIKCHSVYRMPDPDEFRVLLSFESQKNPRLTTGRIKRALNEIGTDNFDVPNDFQRLSAAFLHLEIKMGTRTDAKVAATAQ
jgi:NDP-sugar pyrophosphorylase family protein